MEPNVRSLLPWRFAPLVAALLLVIGADRLSKAWVLATIWDPPRTLVVVPGWLELTPVANRGIAFGLLQDAGGILAGVAILILGFVGLRSSQQVLAAPLFMRISFGLIGGGAIGNLIDRAHLGYVTDFLRVPSIELFQVFNVADAAIVVGTAMCAVALHGHVPRRARGRQPSAPVSAPTPDPDDDRTAEVGNPPPHPSPPPQP